MWQGIAVGALLLGPAVEVVVADLASYSLLGACRFDVTRECCGGDLDCVGLITILMMALLSCSNLLSFHIVQGFPGCGGRGADMADCLFISALPPRLLWGCASSSWSHLSFLAPLVHHYCVWCASVISLKFSPTHPPTPFYLSISLPYPSGLCWLACVCVCPLFT